jgi:hypothetical protein
MFKRAGPVPATESAQVGRRGDPHLVFDASIRAIPFEHRPRPPRARPAGAARWFVVAYCVHRADFLPSSACLVALLPYVRGDLRVQSFRRSDLCRLAGRGSAYPAHRERISCPSCPSRAHILPILPIASAHPAHRERPSCPPRAHILPRQSSTLYVASKHTERLKLLIFQHADCMSSHCG